MTRTRIILNPSSGRERGVEQVDLIARLLQRRFDTVGLSVTAGEGDAGRAAVMAVADGCQSIFVAGGDGTLNEVMKGLASAGALHKVVVGIVPFGTGNDFAAALGIPLEPEPALEVLLAGRELTVDLGAQFGIAPEDLTLDLGPVGRLL